MKGTVEWLFGRPVTTDPARAQAKSALAEWSDLKDQAREQTRLADLQKDPKQRRAFEERAAALRRQAELRHRAAGLAGARDMTDVEAGEDLAAATVAGIRARKRREEEKKRRADYEQKVIQPPSQPNAAVPWAEAIAARRAAANQPAPVDVPAIKVTPSDFGEPAGGGLLGAISRGRAARDAATRLKSELTPDLDAAAGEAMERYNGRLQAEGMRAVGIGETIAERLRALFNFTATPTIAPRFSTPPAAQPMSNRGAAAVPSVHLTQHIYGSADPTATARAALRQQNRAVRTASAGALHDVGSLA
jgi:hypothetical protein